MVRRMEMKILTGKYEGELNYFKIHKAIIEMLKFLGKNDFYYPYYQPKFEIRTTENTMINFLAQYDNEMNITHWERLKHTHNIDWRITNIINDGCVEIIAKFLLVQYRLIPKGVNWWKEKWERIR